MNKINMNYDYLMKWNQHCFYKDKSSGFDDNFVLADEYIHGWMHILWFWFNRKTKEEKRITLSSSRHRDVIIMAEIKWYHQKL